MGHVFAVIGKQGGRKASGGCSASQCKQSLFSMPVQHSGKAKRVNLYSAQRPEFTVHTLRRANLQSTEHVRVHQKLTKA